MKELTAEQRYAAAIEKQFEEWLEASFTDEALKDVELFEHTVPSGITFKVRNITPEFFALSGGVPLGELSEAVIGKASDPEDLDLTEKQLAAKLEQEFNALSADEKLRRMQQTSRQIRYICVEPRIVLDAGGHKNAIPSSKISIPDFNSLAVRANPMGGATAQGLRTFRRKRR